MSLSFTRRGFLQQTLGAALQRGAAQPNIVLMMADDLGYECLSCYGSSSYRTPNLDRLAGAGVRFTHAYAQPLCTPTRIQLLTGKSNFRNWQAFGVMDPKEKTAGHYLQEWGYRTCIAGKWQLWSYNPPDFEPEWRGKGMLPHQSGFNDYCLWHTGHTEDKGSRYGDPTVVVNGTERKNLQGQYGEDIFADFVNGFMETNRNRPFFVYYPMALTHAPFMPTPRSAAWAAGNRLQAGTQNFKDMVEYMDGAVGRVVQQVDRLGLAERTLILFYSDNGTDQLIESRLGNRVVRGGKGLTTDAGTRVPLIARCPGMVPAGRVLDDLVDSTDFLPTLAGLAGRRLPRGVPFDGVSFLPQLRGKTGKPRDWIYSWYDPRPGHDKEQFRRQRFARDQRWKLYDDGRLYEVPRDELEMHALRPDEGGPEARRAQRKLRDVIDRMMRQERTSARGTL
jgi:arylsulfatase A-like enzyme